MASFTVLGRLPGLRVSSRLSLSARSYVTARTTYATKKTVVATKTPAANASTATGENKNNADSAIDEADVADALAVPRESVPSSSVLQAAQSGPAFASEADSLPSLSDNPQSDWSRSYYGLSVEPFPKEIADVLLAPIDPMDVEMKPDGLIYLPEIKYRRVLNKAFGPGGWGLAPRSETNVGPRIVSREYALVCLGRLVAVARGEQEYFSPDGIPTATEACKSNALMRCCKDLGIASELWDPRFIREFKANYCVEVYGQHAITKQKKKLWRRKDQPRFEYPFKE